MVNLTFALLRLAESTPKMQAWCGCGKFVIPATLLSRKLNRHASFAARNSRLSRVEHRSASRCKRSLHAASTAAVEEVTATTQSPSLIDHKPSFRAFLDFKALKADLDKHVANCRDRNSNANPRKIASLYDQFCEAQQQVESIREDRNANAKAMKASNAKSYRVLARCSCLRPVSMIVACITGQDGCGQAQGACATRQELERNFSSAGGVIRHSPRLPAA